MTTIYFVRHGSVHNPQDIFYGRLPRFRLSTEGLRQARAAAHSFQGKPIQAVFSSPMLRARQTAQVIAQSLGHSKVAISAYLNEVRTPFEGCPTRDLIARNWDLYTGVKYPYEQPVDVFNRAYKFILAALKAYPGQQIVAVTHADIIVFLSLWANGYAVNFENKSLIEHERLPFKFPSPASVTSLSWETMHEVPTFAYFIG